MNVISKRWSSSVLESITKEENRSLWMQAKRNNLLMQAILQLAAKSNKKELVEYVLRLNRSLATLKNLKGKAPNSYCKIVETFSLFGEQGKQDIFSTMNCITKLFFRIDGFVSRVWGNCNRKDTCYNSCCD